MRGVPTIFAAFAAAMLMTSLDVRAQDLFDFLFGPDRPPPHAAEPSRWAQQPHANPRWAPRPHVRPRVAARARLRFARLVEPKASSASSSGESSFATTRSDGFCVRTCDGYFFPLIKSEFVTRQQSCEYACPSAPMAVYEGSAIEQAQNHRGEKYKSLPTAFSFRDKVTQRCSCNRPERFPGVLYAHLSRRSDPARRGHHSRPERSLGLSRLGFRARRRIVIRLVLDARAAAGITRTSGKQLARGCRGDPLQIHTRNGGGTRED